MRRNVFAEGAEWETGLVVAAALVAGAFGGLTVVTVGFGARLAAIESALRDRLAATTTRPAFELVTVQPRTTEPVAPAAIVSRRQSPLLTVLVRRGGKTPEERLVDAEQELGAAIALTSDGWIVTAAPTVGGVRAADLLVAWNGRAYPVTSAVRDTATDAVFLKIAVNDLPVTALVRASDVASGSAVWLEPRAGRFSPGWVSDVRVRAQTEPVSSERATRRFLVTGALDGATPGTAAWDVRGQLVGLLEQKTGDGWRALPAGHLASALDSLLATRTIVHASLGNRASDLSMLVFEGARELPEQGAWLRADRARGLPAVNVGGPAAAFLREGDVIERIERDILDGRADLGERLLDYRPGTDVAVYGRRGAQSFQLEIRLGSVTSSEPLK